MQIKLLVTSFQCNPVHFFGPHWHFKTNGFSFNAPQFYLSPPVQRYVTRMNGNIFGTDWAIKFVIKLCVALIKVANESIRNNAKIFEIKLACSRKYKQKQNTEGIIVNRQKSPTLIVVCRLKWTKSKRKNA